MHLLQAKNKADLSVIGPGLFGADGGIRTRPNCLGSSYATTTSHPHQRFRLPETQEPDYTRR